MCIRDRANGVLAGYPMVDVKAKLYDGSYHDVDSSETAFKIAASLALKEAAKSAQPAILEPMMLVTITVPEENLGDVMGHVTARRGRVDGMEAHGNSQIVRAYVPLAEMFGYATVLRSASQGRGPFMMVFDHYEDVPTVSYTHLCWQTCNLSNVNTVRLISWSRFNLMKEGNLTVLL